MQVVIATPADIPRLAELLGLLFAQEAEFTPNAENQARGLKAIIAEASVGLILVLKDGEAMVGMVNLLFTVSTYLGARVALLEDMIIHPDHRGKGAGTLLMKAALQMARERGCRRVTLLTDGDNAVAKAFYGKMGFVKSAMEPYVFRLT